ncbi:response regulator receiver protein [Flexistipes sinusarabici DSM 4947]|uniref:Response regulator receiver protein n=1 Tax=Flexistipes sinusarabici (strain ATCC 49648 / DSM 4947 / MAS 10) TaxID=717231 RepID=F8E5M4_FLESM|nr:response regulator [Flexistipes sinusarabici]AEI14655.1 response regulator receiver protein [Flexistipes sinusarabici DSM 4947]
MSSEAGLYKILIMDDQELILESSSELLTILGYDVETSKNGEEAASLFENAYNEGEPFDLVILDLTVPGGMGGVKTLATMKKITSDFKAVVSSGYSNDPIMSDYKNYGFDGVLIKPFKLEVLQETLDKLFRD